MLEYKVKIVVPDYRHPSCKNGEGYGGQLEEVMNDMTGQGWTYKHTIPLAKRGEVEYYLVFERESTSTPGGRW